MLAYLPLNYYNGLSMDDLPLLKRIGDDFPNFSFFSLFFPKSGFLYFRPFLDVTYYIDYKIWGETISGYHFTNYLLHVLNAGLLYNIGLCFFKNKEKPYFYASIAMLVFALNPLTCESVAWVSGRSDIAATFFILLSVNCFFIRNKIRFVLTPFFILLGLFCKESALSIFPIIIFLVIYTNHYKVKSTKKLLLLVGLWFFIILIPISIYIYLRTASGSNIGSTPERIASAAAIVSDPKTSIVNISGYYRIFPAIAFYLKKLIIPFPLNFSISTINFSLYSQLFVFIVISNIYWIIKKCWNYVVIGFLLIVSFSPALPVAIGGIAWTPFAERYLYQSLCIWGLSISYLSCYFVSVGKVKTLTRNVFLGLLIVVSILGTIYRQTEWQSNEKLFSRTMKTVDPGNYKAIFNYAVSHNRKDRIKDLRKAETASKDEPDLFWRANLYRAIANYYAQYNQPENYLKIPGVEQEPANENNNYIHLEMSEYKIVTEVFRNLDIGLNLDSGHKAYMESAIIVLKLQPENNELQKQVFERAHSYYFCANTKKPEAFLLYRIGGLENLLGNNEKAAEYFNIVISKFPESNFAGYAKTRLRKFKEEGLIK